ncbi:MAG TPA: DUF547 domain-containing protein [Limnobacter sp.]|nr:DUF547 domain-containing protein [Limnobacter sp.]
MPRRFFFACMLLAAMATPWPALAALDHDYKAWNALLNKHVRWLPDGKQSEVDYTALARERAALGTVLSEWSAVTPTEFKAFSKAQQMAFLINAYNGFTLELVLSAYPKIKSIKDIGGLFGSPWKKEFFTLLGAKRHLDWIEHEQLRPLYKEPRVHVAVNCASVGCPALRNEAYTASRLDAQLEDGMRRFLSDPSRNRVRGGELEVSPIFKWFADDFEQGHQGFYSVKDVFARWARFMSSDPAVVEKIASKSLPVAFTQYDWSLNDTKP